MMQEIYWINETRTNNFNDREIAAKIGGLWQEAKKLQQTDATFYGIYADYESDYKGDYTVSVASNMPHSENTKKIMIPEQPYQIFNVEKDVFATWQEIWNTELHRSYLFDYEEYAPDGSIRIYIGLNA